MNGQGGAVLLTAGVNYKSAGLADLGRYAPGNDAVRKALQGLRGRFGEALVLATCNRTEVTVLTAHPDRAAAAIARIVFPVEKDSQTGETPEGFFELRGREAVSHLFAVAAGLESVVLGEKEVLGQVRRAADSARGEKALGAVLGELCKMAVAAGRRVRRETDVEAGERSFARTMVTMARDCLGSLEGKTLLVLGAGQAAKTVLSAFRRVRLGERLVANRTAGRAQTLAEGFGAHAVAMAAVPELAAKADILVLASAAVPRLDQIFKSLSAGAARPVLVFDLGPAGREAPAGAGFAYRSLADILGAAAQTGGPNAAVVQQARSIVDDETSSFFAWWARQDVIPVVKGLIAKADAIRDEAVESALRRLGPLEPDQQEAVRYLAQSIAKKLLHQPLTQITDPVRGRRLARAAAELFGLEDPAPASEAERAEAGSSVEQ